MNTNNKNTQSRVAEKVIRDIFIRIAGVVIFIIISVIVFFFINLYNKYST